MPEQQAEEERIFKWTKFLKNLFRFDLYLPKLSVHLKILLKYLHVRAHEVPDFPEG